MEIIESFNSTFKEKREFLDFGKGGGEVSKKSGKCNEISCVLIFLDYLVFKNNILQIFKILCTKKKHHVINGRPLN